MDLIRDIADWIAKGWGDRLGLLFPLLVAGLLGLYLLWLLIGYLRVSQIGIGESRSGARPTGEVLHLGTAANGTAPGGSSAPASGTPYCPVDNLQFPAGARYCTVCERDLSLTCTNCGATLRAADASCYNCGVPTREAERLLA